MIRRFLLPGVVVFAFFLAGCWGRGDQPARKNLLLIGVDTLRADALGSAGNPEVRTPALDLLARRGIQCFGLTTHIPITAPAFATLFTGLYPREHGVLNNTYALREEETTLAEILEKEGYATAAVVSGHVLDKPYGLAQGFVDYDDQFFRDRSAGEAVEKAIGWLGIRDRTRPFFLWLHCIDPHIPYTGPRPFKEAHGLAGASPGVQPEEVHPWHTGEKVPTEGEMQAVRKAYWAEVDGLDAGLARLFREMDHQNLWKETVVVFLADHGECLAEREFYVGHAMTLGEEVLLVPLLWLEKNPAGPGLRAGKVRMIDILPTLLESLEIRVDTPLRGAPLTGVLAGTEPDSNRPVLAETFAPEGGRDQMALTDRGWKEWKVLRLPPKEKFRISRLGPQFTKEPAPELESLAEGRGFHLEDDPGERVSLPCQNLLKKTVFKELLKSLPPREIAMKPTVDAERMEELKRLGYVH